MTEFEVMRKALEIVYDEVEVYEWDFDNSALIIVKLFGITTYHWFKDGKLESIENDIDYPKIKY